MPNALEGPASDWEKLRSIECYQEHGALRHYEITIRVKKVRDLKVKLLKNFFPALSEEHDHLLKSKKEVTESRTVDRAACECRAKMVDSHNKTLENKKTKLSHDFKEGAN